MVLGIPNALMKTGMMILIGLLVGLPILISWVSFRTLPKRRAVYASISICAIVGVFSLAFFMGRQIREGFFQAEKELVERYSRKNLSTWEETQISKEFFLNRCALARHPKPVQEAVFHRIRMFNSEEILRDFRECFWRLRSENLLELFGQWGAGRSYVLNTYSRDEFPRVRMQLLNLILNFEPEVSKNTPEKFRQDFEETLEILSKDPELRIRRIATRHLRAIRDKV